MDTFVSEEEAAQFREYMADPASRAAFAQFKAEAASNGTARRYEHVLRAVASRPWAIDEPMLSVIVDVLTFRAYGGRLTAEEIEGRIGASRRTPSTESPRGVARIPVSGVIMPKGSAMSDISGGTSAEAIGNAIRSAVNTPDVSSIVLDIDSPGGAVDGIPELAALIADANRIKPVTAVANHEAASAAYWLASQAGRIIASPSARVGSIGVISKHEDESDKNERAGVKTTLISAGKHKAEGSPWEPLSEDAHAHLQAMVDEFYGMFVEAVASGRGVTAAAVQSGFGEGRMVTAKNALALGMVDGIGTIESVIQEELATPETRAQTAARVGAHVLSVVPDAPAVSAQATEDHPSAGRIEVEFEDEPPAADAEWVDVSRAVAEAAAPDPTVFNTSQNAEIDRLLANLHKEPSDEPVDPRIAAAVDASPWDGNKAMGECSTAAEYRSICAGERTVGQPDERQHWALPHHYLGKGPNEAGVRAALSRISQTQNLKNRAAAQGHLDAHMNVISPPGDDARSEVLDEEMEAIKAQLDVLAGLPE